MFSLVIGSHTEQAYSSDGRTRDLYACSLTVVELMLMFLRRNPSVLFAFVVILFIWLSHLRSDCIVTPRYLALSACSSWCPCRVHEYFIGVLFHVMDSTLHLSGWKTIFHFCSPFAKRHLILGRLSTVSNIHTSIIPVPPSSQFLIMTSHIFLSFFPYHKMLYSARLDLEGYCQEALGSSV